MQEHSRHDRQLQRAAPQLAFDLLAVLCGARPAFLLDYAPVKLRSLTSLLQAVSAVASVQCESAAEYIAQAYIVPVT